MEDLLSSILEVVSEIVGEFLFEIVFPNLSLYPLLPKKERSKKARILLQCACYVPAVIAILTLFSPLVCLIFEQPRSAVIICGILAGISLAYIAVVFVINVVIKIKE
ncbi:MAG: hypothetical protein IJW70_10090 [Clostridia bacterium]|nr:hypothetical protein [Clostridia bacterium]